MFALHAIASLFSPARLAKTAYLFVLAANISLLLAPNPSHGQFRGLPAVHPFPGVPLTAVLPNFSGSMSSPFSGSFNAGFSSMPFTAFSIPYIPQTVGLPGSPMQFPLNNFMSDSTGGSLALGSGLGFGGFGIAGYPGFGGFGIAGSPGFGGFGGFNGISGAGGIGGAGGLGLSGPAGFGAGMGGFAGKGIGGFNGRKPL